METLTTNEELQAWLERSNTETVLLYKHSATCPFSARAQGVVSELKHDLPIATIVVQYAREVSQQAAALLEVQHETPQVIVVRNGKASSELAHARITKEAILEAMHPSEEE